MKIILMRHFKVNFNYPDYCNSREFDQASIMYNISPVIDQPVNALTTERLYASSMKRARQTAELAFAKKPLILAGVYEVTMKSAMQTSKQYPTWLWEVWARLAWRCGHASQYESYQQTLRRLAQAIDLLESRQEDATVVMHGLAMRHMSQMLLKRGYRGKLIIKATNGTSYTFEKE